jgi:hypothetical protein
METQTIEKLLSKCTIKQYLKLQYGKNQISISNRHIRKKFKIQGDRRKFSLVRKNSSVLKNQKLEANNKTVWNCFHCNKGKKGQGWIK